MTSILIDRLDGLSSSVAYKGPCRVATTANIALSGLQTIDGVVLAESDRVLVKGQTDARENGVYVVDTGPWRRARDFYNGRDVAKGTKVAITDGTENAGREYEVTTSNPISIGTSEISFRANVATTSGGVTPQAFGAVGNGVANDTTAVSNFFASGGGNLVVPAGTYLIDDIDISAPVDVRCHPDAIFRRRSAPATTSDLIAFVAGSEGSVWRGGVIDGDRGTHQATYDTGGAPIWSELAIRANEITVRDLKVKNAIYHGIIGNKGATDADRLDDVKLYNIVSEDCTTNAFTNFSNLRVDGFHSKRPDNDGMPVDVRGFSINTIHGGRIDHILVEDMTGDANVPSPTNAVTGVLGLDLYNVDIGSIVVRHSYGSAVFALCISLAEVVGCSVGYLEADDYCGIGIELVNFDSHLKSFFTDAHYRGPSAGTYTAATSIGLTTHGSWVYPLGNRSREINRARAAQGLVENGRIRRVGIAHDSAAPGLRFRNVRSIGALSQGIKHWSSDTTIIPYDVTYEDCGSTFCQSTGLSIRSGSAIIVGGRFANNGQDSSLGSTLRVGIGYTGSDTLDKLTIPVPPLLEDTQAAQVTNAVSYKPGTAAQDYEPNSDYYVLTMTQLSRHRINIGQTLTFKLLTGSDATGTIIDIDHDEITVKVASAIFATGTGNTTNLTGTWSGSGTTLTGVGTAATTELKEGHWIDDGSGNWRQVQNIASNTSIEINAAFASPLSGATLKELSIDVHEIPSQQFGAYLNNASVSAVQAVGWIGSGNVSALTSFSSSTTRSGGAVAHSDRFLTRTFTLADDAATSFTPGVATGLLIIVDDTNTAGAVVFQLDASPLCTLAFATTPSVATVAATTGSLAGTTGTDAFLTLSAHTDGKIYIENRRGASRTFSCFIIGSF